MAGGPGFSPGLVNLPPYYNHKRAIHDPVYRLCPTLALALSPSATAGAAHELTPQDIFVQVLNKFFDYKGRINFENLNKTIFYHKFAICLNKLF